MYFIRKQKHKQNVIKIHCDVIYLPTSHTIFSQDRVRKYFFIYRTHVYRTMPILKIYYIFIFKFCIRLKKIVILLYMNVALYKIDGVPMNFRIQLISL